MDRDAVALQLRRYCPEDPREAGYLERMLALLTLPEPFARTNYVPGHFTASAFVLSPDQRSVLLVFHRKLGLLIQPGGHVEPSDENLELAARREIAEEVGLRELLPAYRGGVFDLDIHRIPARPNEPAHEHFDVRFAFLAPSFDLAPNEEVRDPSWVALSQVGNVGSDASVRRAAEKLRVRDLELG